MGKAPADGDGVRFAVRKERQVRQPCMAPQAAPLGRGVADEEDAAGNVPDAGLRMS